MTELQFFDGLLGFWFIMAAVAFVSLFWLPAPYGRMKRAGWGPELPARWGWIGMELPAVVVPLVCFGLSARMDHLVVGILLGMWLLHYLQRTFVYPFRMRMSGKTMPFLVAALAFFTNIGINYLNARWLYTLGPEYSSAWLLDPRFLIGVTLFLFGFVLNLHSDHILANLRKPGETGYKVPRGGLYRWISCPNYAGELLEWTGWALACWSLPALAFAVWSAANLVPRARENHRWYQRSFDDYPAGRKALIPGVW